MYTAADLADIILRLKRFMRADVARCDRAATVASPVPHASVRVVYATPAAASPPVVATLTKPDQDAFTSRDALAHAFAAHTTELMSAIKQEVSVLRAHASVGAPIDTPRKDRPPPPPQGRPRRWWRKR